MSKQRLAIVILALAGVISCFLPWVSSILSILGFKVLTGQICLGLLAVVLIISLIGDIKKDLRDWQLLVPYTVGILSLVTSVLHILFLSALNSKNTFINDLPESGYETGFAPYITASVSLLICVLIFALKDSQKELENMTIVRRVVKKEQPVKKKRRKTSRTAEEENPIDRKKQLLSKPTEAPPAKAPAAKPTPTKEVEKPTAEPAPKKDSGSSNHDRFMPK